MGGTGERGGLLTTQARQHWAIINVISPFVADMEQCEWRCDTYHETVAVLDQDVPGAAVALEEPLQIAFPHAVGQTPDVYSWTNHSSVEVGKPENYN